MSNSTNVGMAGVAGAVIGAGAAVAAAKVLSNKKTSKRVGEVVNALKDKVVEATQSGYEKGMDMKDKGRGMTKEAASKVAHK